tara:strand:- start:981 stop:1451 length:471 start_codon:yes stop_codon:yes gene_type:complete
MNPKAWFFIGFAVVVAGFVSLLQGCDLATFVRVKVPAAVQEAIGVPDSVSYAEAESAWNEWKLFVQINSDRMASEIEAGRERFELLQSVANTGLEALGENASLFPGGGLLVGVLGGVGGLFVRRPGDKKKMVQAVQKGFQEGVSVALTGKPESSES